MRLLIGTNISSICYTRKMTKSNEVTKEVTQVPEQDDNSDIDINIIIETFQEKINNLMTELIIKEARIKQQAIIIQQLKRTNVT